MKECPSVNAILAKRIKEICPTIVLASQSPNRKKLLEDIGLTVITKAQDINEICGYSEPGKVVSTLSRQKLDSYIASSHFDKTLVAIAVDTLVCMDGKLLGKPCDDKEAFNMLRSLSGREHEVYSGLSLYNPNKQKVETKCVLSTVVIKDLSDEDIAWYISTNDPKGAAGSYKIQSHGYKIIESIGGSFSNIIGLPLECLLELLS